MAYINYLVDEESLSALIYRLTMLESYLEDNITELRKLPKDMQSRYRSFLSDELHATATLKKDLIKKQIKK